MRNEIQAEAVENGLLAGNHTLVLPVRTGKF